MYTQTAALEHLINENVDDVHFLDNQLRAPKVYHLLQNYSYLKKMQIYHGDSAFGTYNESAKIINWF